MKKSGLVSLLLIFSLALNAQIIVSAELISSKTKEEFKAEFPVFNFMTDVDGYRVTYNSVDVHGNPDTLSGIIALPKDTMYVYPRIAYMHGTVDNRWAVPSQLNGEGNLAMAYGSMGGIAIAPDYPGLGEGRGFHPYVHVESQARSGIDLLRAALELAEEHEVHYHDGILITGYSQGGHAAQGMHKEIEEKYASEFNVSASAPMSGPYSISGVMLDFVLDGNEYGTPAYLPNVVHSMQTAYGNIYSDLSEIFKEPYVAEIQRYYDEEIGLFDLNTFLLAKLQEIEGDFVAVKLFQDDVITEIMTNEDYPFMVALRANDLVDWAPQAPVRMYYCIGDDQVNYQNALVAETGMQAAGGLDVQAVQAGGEAFDHGDCVFPATLGSSNFLLQYQNLSIYTSAEEAQLDEGIRFFPNPALDQINIVSEYAELTDASYDLVNISGKNVMGHTDLTSNQIDLSGFANGLYILKIYDRDGVIIHRSKLIKQ